jgi:hypothetical protein
MSQKINFKKSVCGSKTKKKNPLSRDATIQQ